MSRTASVAPKERVNIVYEPADGGADGEVELPLKLLVLGQFQLEDDTQPLPERRAVNINKDNFDAVLSERAPRIDLTVDNHLGGDDPDLQVSLEIRSMKDFEPDALVQQVPQLRALMQLRAALSCLKGPIGNLPRFRKRLQEMFSDPELRRRLLEELTDESEAAHSPALLEAPSPETNN